ncbi:MAG: O-antigen ligase family protein [Lachnospiraceae bacterium]|nr:O-antigen ligase family protein [Lachnospiraceae bacterium]
MKGLIGKLRTGIFAILASVYIIIMLIIYPLYLKDGYVYIAWNKFLFFRAVNVVAIIAAAVCFLVYPAAFRGIRRKFRNVRTNSPDIIMLLVYGAVTVISFFIADDRAHALWGDFDWDMGLLTQLIFIFSYLLIRYGLSREYHIKDIPIKGLILFGSLVTYAVVCVLELIQRFGFDPFGWYADFGFFDWNRRNLFSTMGNINWLCGYMVIMLAIAYALYMEAEGETKLFYGIVAFAGSGALLLNGSMSGIFAYLFIMLALYLYSLSDGERFLRLIELLMMPMLFMSVLTVLNVPLLSSVENDLTKLYTPLWGVGFFLLTLVYIMLSLFGINEKRDIISVKPVQLFMKAVPAVLGIFAFIILIMCQLSDDFWRSLGSIGFLKFDDSWGTMRGYVWRTTVQGFFDMPFINKLFGTGPDSYVLYMNENYNLTGLHDAQWNNTIYANAHNEFLTMLINGGILGAVSYIAIFVAAMSKFVKNKSNPYALTGILAVTAYMSNQFFSFQTVCATPFIFIIMALCMTEES